ncbi:hypothetical protein KMD50_gp42 [Lactococcus phage PLgW-1]|uniref:Uncharacterized protein n=3 Tax=Uwajimavirus PLgW1 TaxID=2845441 RepID=A0A2Z2P2X2_9CAUD|nr:hypothetical protein KMD50_gp42 [Lactococcus phage PLgW-1]ARQ94853.1 hypothetical protein PLgW1_42 [Lactococcus phage PLgW-1]ASJ80025.1 hypothetical protein [Lactococcus phage PLgY-16]ASJ80078.1 hypothetical protein [Lactococcus phage PLgY-30]
MSNNTWVVIQNTKTKLFIAVEAIDSYALLTTNEELIRTNLTKAQALQKAKTMNEILDRAKEIL